MKAPQQIAELVAHFEANKDSLKSGSYNETQLRREFVDPFFEVLGWDVQNKQHYASAYKDVVHEDAVKVGTAMKAPDYSFRVGGVRKFFVETKKPAVNIKEDIAPSFQLRRYGWSAKLPLSILTDFEEFAIYDCRTKPSKTDKASVGRVLYMTYKDYLECWDEIESVFSHEAILKGSFDKFAETAKGKRGTQEVDDAFLEEIEKWRELLAKNIALRNTSLSQRELNFAVQQTIDRLVFLRICEDRGTEQYGRLLAEVNGADIYGRLKKHFRDADDRYNSGLFHFKEEKNISEAPDTLTLGLRIDDDTLKKIISNLYYPDSAYEFSVLPADILGHVYEQFLGKVIRLTEGHQAKIEEKPEVRKAGGVFYTPTYIVDYIVQNTVGKLVEGKTPKQIEKIKILDPACGSGSFLLGAYQFLLDWHLKYYLENDPKKNQKALYQGVGGDWRLNSAERKRILLNNIYGVDIDSQAVEVTKLSLLLKVLEGETDQTLGQQMTIFKERALPNLGSNIKCGNSLIGPDFYATQQMGMFGEEEMYRINSFDWEKEFPSILTGNHSGFDAVIGNPPYIRIQAMKEWAPVEVEYYKKRYRSASKGNYDIYVVFVERMLMLLSKEGLLGYILPHKFFNAKYGEELREILSKGNHVNHVVHFGDQQVFKGATTYTCLLFLSNAKGSTFTFVKVDNLNDWKNSFEGMLGEVDAGQINKNEWNITIGEGSALFEKMKNMPTKLGDISDIFVGLQTSADTVFLFKNFKKNGNHYRIESKVLGNEVDLEGDLLKPVVRSGKIGRYNAEPTALVLFPYERVNGKFGLISSSKLQAQYPKTWEYLVSNKKLLSEREHGKFDGEGWYQLYPKNLDLWEQNKIMLPYMITRLSAYFDQNNYYFVNVTTGGFGVTLNDVKESPLYVTALLNSKVLDWFMKEVSTNFHGGYFAANKQFLVQLPIKMISFSNSAEKKVHDEIVNLSQNMHQLNEQLKQSKTPHEQDSTVRRIEAVDKQINSIVYELYELSNDEIQIVESSTATE